MRRLGYVGKVPHRGDFVRYNVPTQVHRVWDDWLGEVLRQAEQTLEGWPSGYDDCSPWQFALSPDIAGDEAYAGVLLASRDGVGRRYPFALLATLPETMTPLETLASEPALDALERLACRAVDVADVYERLKASLGELQDTLQRRPQDPAAAPFRPGASTRATEPAVFSEDAELLADRAGTTRLLDAVLRQSSGPYSVWRRRDEEAKNGCLLVSGGLPQGSAAFTLFGAEWSTSVGGRLDGSTRTDTCRPQRHSHATTASVTGVVTSSSPSSPRSASAATAAASTVVSTPPIGTSTASDGRAETPDAVPLSVAAVAERPRPRDAASNIAGSAGHDTRIERAPEPAVDGAAPPVTAAGGPPAADADPAERTADAPSAQVEPSEVETLKIDDEEGEAPWDSP